jgi:hypothetical protein
MPMFDPYRKWLDLPHGQRPPTHYLLLGVAPGEADPEIIKEAALRQTSRVRVYQTGPHAELCTRLLNEIAQARAVLLNPKLREDYDARLHPRKGPLRTGDEPDGEMTPPAPGSSLFVPSSLIPVLAYGLLLLVGFVSSFCFTLHSLRTAAEARTAPAGDRAP